MPWYEGPTLLETFESLPVLDELDEQPFRFPVQLLNRPQTADLPDYRGFMGTIASGTVKVGDRVMVLPTGKSSKVKEIVTFDGNLDEAFAPQSVSITLEDEIDISRGDMLVRGDSMLTPQKEITANVCWIGDEPLEPKKKYWIKHTTNTLKAMVTSIDFRTDIHSLEQNAADQLAMNEIGQIQLKLLKPVYADSYAKNRVTGSFILIDSFTNNTAGAGMII
jgi:sulfate adenylyltransferase subunit 1